MSEFWVNKLISSAVLVALSALFIWLMLRRADRRFRAAVEAANLEFAAKRLADEAAADALDDACGEPLGGWDGPIVVDAAELRGLIRAAVREALAEAAGGTATPSAPAVTPG